MSLQVCGSCGGKYSVGAPECPQCGGTEFKFDYETEPVSVVPEVSDQVPQDSGETAEQAAKRAQIQAEIAQMDQKAG